MNTRIASVGLPASRKTTLSRASQLVALVVAAVVTTGLMTPWTGAAWAQIAPTASTAVSETTIKALQEALNKQGIAVPVDGTLNDRTRTAIRQYQSQHHLPVTGEPDTATLAKLGVAARQSTMPSPQTTTQAAPGAQAQTPASPQMPMQGPGGMMMGGSMMGSPMMMRGMMQMMQGMMQMMHGQMQSGSPQAGRPRDGMMMNCPMMQQPAQGATADQMQGMMQMMRGMMSMMQGQMRPGGVNPPAQ
ncbi:MAG: peptidoglycan-binding protein [Alphaproteobacteria bacterium]|nr:peptidoglycan-binding protein [Alphaproteobacteria bacterium]